MTFSRRLDQGEMMAFYVLSYENWMGTDPAKRAFYRAFRDLNPLNNLGIG